MSKYPKLKKGNVCLGKVDAAFHDLSQELKIYITGSWQIKLKAQDFRWSTQCIGQATQPMNLIACFTFSFLFPFLISLIVPETRFKRGMK